MSELRQQGGSGEVDDYLGLRLALGLFFHSGSMDKLIFWGHGNSDAPSSPSAGSASRSARAEVTKR